MEGRKGQVRKVGEEMRHKERKGGVEKKRKEGGKERRVGGEEIKAERKRVRGDEKRGSGGEVEVKKGQRGEWERR